MFDDLVAGRGRVRHLANPRFRRPRALPASNVAAARIRASVRGDPDYHPTPLLWRSGAARRMGLGALALKYEGARLAETGLASFKPIGVMAAMGSSTPRRDADVHTLVCASDGNWGRAVAWGACRAGLHARIFLPDRVSRERFAGVERFGAEAVAVAGGYDCAMAEAAAAARAPGVLEMSDTGYPGSETVPGLVGAGYGVIAEECLSAWPDDLPAATHLFVPAGVGGLAAGLIDRLEEVLGPDMPALVTVEPIGAESLLESLSAAELRSTPDIDGSAVECTRALQCLACETPSTTAWPVLRCRVAHALAISDGPAIDAVRALADGQGNPPVVAGESGAAGFAALASVCRDPTLRRRLGLDGRSRVLVIVTEGATDRASYRSIVGSDPDRLPMPLNASER